MKSIRKIILALGMVFSLHLLHAQTATVGSFNGDIMQVQSAQADSIVGIVAEAQGLQLVSPDQVPPYGTFWTVLPGPGGGVIPPSPCPPLDPGLPIYAIADGQFLVDGTIGNPVTLNTPQTGRLAAGSTSAVALEAQADAVLNLITRVQTAAANRQMWTMAMDVPTPGYGGDYGVSGDYPSSYVAYTFDTNQLWLEITNVSGGLVYLNLHNGTNQVYATWGTTNLLANWNVEIEVWPTNGEVMPFTVTTLDRPNLFLRAQDWTGVTENGNTTPCWWLWAYFGTTALSDTDLDSTGTNTLLYDFTNGIDPNPIGFSFSVANQYVATNLVSGVITIWGGLPSSIAVLVDDMNFAEANWTAYTSSNLTVDIGTNQGAHDVWVGLRGSLPNAQQTWEETTLILDSIPPTISITSPADNVSFNASRVNICGNFTAASLKQIAVNGILAFVNVTNFEARNVPLNGGANTITAVIEDLTGMTNVASITVTGITNADGSMNNPVQLQATPVAGFVPLPVGFQITSNSAPGTVQQVLYDFNGDDITDFATNDLGSVTYTYETNGEYFPVVTLQTGVGSFSSIGGWNGVSLDGSNQPVRINVQSPPTQSTLVNITDPVDLKWDGTHLYVLSGSGAAIYEFATNGDTVRSLSLPAGSNPSGLDVDSAGNVYVAVTASNQVWKFSPTDDSFQADSSFGNNGVIGIDDGSSGSGAGEFNAPFDVAVSPDGGTISVADSGNNRIQQFDISGNYLNSFGSLGSAVGQFNSPKGLTYDSVGVLYIVDSGNNRIVLAQGGFVEGVTGANGKALGQFSGPVNISVGERGVYVADTGNNRIQKFDLPASGLFNITPASIGYAVSTNLSQPAAIAAVNSLTNEMFYVADTGSNRVVLCSVPGDSPDALQAVWNNMAARVAAGNIPGATRYFSSSSMDGYRQAFLCIGNAKLISDINAIGPLTPVYIKNDQAEYYFEQTIGGQLLLFPVEFNKENGVWKISEF